MRILADFHHLSLYNSLVRLFGDRLGHEVVRPIGMDWFYEGFWAINSHVDTARQYLVPDHIPSDGTPGLNDSPRTVHGGRVWLNNPEDHDRPHMGAELQWFKDTPFDVLIASIPQHIEPFRRLIRLYQPNAKLIIQLGNSWGIGFGAGDNVLSSIEKHEVHGYAEANSVTYHQEFDTRLFHPMPVPQSSPDVISSYVNCLKEYPRGWADFLTLERALPDVRFRSYGGQCRDGCLSIVDLAWSMMSSQLVLHSKPGGDGYGHVIHSAYAVGRVVILRRSDYVGKLADRLMTPGTYLDLDELGMAAPATVQALLQDPDELYNRSEKAACRFRVVVDFERDAFRVRRWLEELR